MKIPVIYNLRSLKQRPVSTLTTALGMALVVAVFVAMMALSNGFREALTSTGSDENVFLLRKGAGAELNSGSIDRTAVCTLSSSKPPVAKVKSTCVKAIRRPWFTQ